jgi:FRG domain
VRDSVGGSAIGIAEAASESVTERPSDARIPSLAMLLSTPPIESLYDFLKVVFEFRRKWTLEDAEHDAKCDTKRSPTQLWFRGLSSVQHDLKPSVYRLSEPDEDEIWSGFMRQGLQLAPDIRLPKDHVEWYFLMQHHGAPTRLLDWTDGALLGLYFALREHPQIDRGKCQHEINDAAVWALDPVWLNRKSLPNSYTEGVLLYDWSEIEPWFPEPLNEKLHGEKPGRRGPSARS